MSAGSDATLRFVMVAGESSGDMHGAAFLRALRELAPGVQVTGIGGPRLRAAGLECLYPAEELSLVGLPSGQDLRRVLSAFRRLLSFLREQPPHLLVLIDFPEFNLFLARFAKRYQIPIFYYISPQVWAWRRGRVRLIRRVVDCMAVILPFEEEFYRKHGVEVHFVGHPLLDVVRPHLARQTLEKLLGLEPQKPILGLFPGSRRGEVQRLLPVFVETFLRLKERHPALQGVVVKAEGLPEGLFQTSAPGLKFVSGYAYEVMNHAQAVLLASGTVTLEAAIVGVPMVVAYKVSPLTYFLGKHLIRVPYVSLVNLIAGKPLVPEFLQKEASPEKLAQALEPLLSREEENQRLRAELKKIKQSLGSPGASWRVAELALRFARARLTRS